MDYEDNARKTLRAIAFLLWNWILVVVSTYGAVTAMNNQIAASTEYYIFYYLLYAISYYGLGLLIYISYYILKVWGIINYLRHKWESYRLYISKQKLRR